jgi:hypothetical protein
MAIVHFTEYEANRLIESRKFVCRIVQDNTEGPPNSDTEKKIVYDIRRRDMPQKDIHLRLCARLAPWVPGSGPKPIPGVSLQWKGHPVRKLDYSLRHDSKRHGVSIGHVKGWHEHVWTDQDEDEYVVIADPPVKAQDIKSLIRWAAEKWNIELDGIDAQRGLGL